MRKAGLSSCRRLPGSQMESAAGGTIGRRELAGRYLGTYAFVLSSSNSRGANLKNAEIHRGAASSQSGTLVPTETKVKDTAHFGLRR